jgi:hypothetical protein
MPKIDVRDTTARGLRGLHQQIPTKQQKLVDELVQRAAITDFTEIGGGRPLKKGDLEHDAAAAFKELSSRHDDVWAQEWTLQDDKKVIVVAHESDKGNLHVRFYDPKGKDLLGKPQTFDVGSMYDGQD